jgi:phospho-N-acetylmuramoyl-pentapeptide-transferase
MLYHLLFPLHTVYGPFNVFRYVTFRTAGAFLTALLVSMILGPPLIQKLSDMRARQIVREDGPQTHLKKAGTPTMGGILILLAVAAATLLWAQLTNRFIWLALLCTLAMGAVGFVDDYLKLKRGTSTGLRPRQKFFWQILIGLSVGAYLYLFPTDQFTTKLAIPFLKRWMPDLGIWYIPFSMLVIVGCSNAVNLTDGLDGLAIGPTLMAAATFTLFSYVAGNAVLAHYLQVIFVRTSSELPVFAAALVGASMGFLWFNAHPAQVFMGDTGSLALGGALATVALVTKNELVLVLAGGCFVAEALSVIIQVFWFKRTGRRVFRMAPIHHHYELDGLAESKIIVRFWIVSFILQVIALTTLKLR